MIGGRSVGPIRILAPSPSTLLPSSGGRTPAEHAAHFSRRYADDLEIATGQVMIDLGLSHEEMGSRDPKRNLGHHNFFPNEGDRGGVSPSGQINVDSGVMNPGALDKPYGEECGKLWWKSKLRDLMQAVIAPERTEHEQGDDHELALIASPETGLPIGHEARELLRTQVGG